MQKQELPEITGNYRKLLEITGNTSHAVENIFSGNYRKLPEITRNFPPWVLAPHPPPLYLPPPPPRWGDFHPVGV
jgi:hypothetical protein